MDSILQARTTAISLYFSCHEINFPAPEMNSSKRQQPKVTREACLQRKMITHEHPHPYWQNKWEMLSRFYVGKLTRVCSQPFTCIKGEETHLVAGASAALSGPWFHYLSLFSVTWRKVTSDLPQDQFVCKSVRNWRAIEGWCNVLRVHGQPRKFRLPQRSQRR